jgi:predicted MFS family arabinose efflux permease
VIAKALSGPLIDRIGAGIGGGIVALVGPSPALAINAAALAVSAMIIFFGLGVADHSQRRPVVEPVQSDALRSYARDLNEGWQFLRREPVLIGITIMVGITNLIDQAWSAVLVPVWARDGGYGAGGVGLMFAVLSGCSILGSVIAAARADKLPRLPLYVIAFMIVGLPRFAIMVVDVPLLMILVVVGVGGFMSGFVNPILGAVTYERIPKPLLGRVLGIYSALCWSLIPFGGLLGGLLVAGFGLPIALLITGGGYFAATLIPLARKSFRGFSRRPDHELVA